MYASYLQESFSALQKEEKKKICATNFSLIWDQGILF